MNIFNRLLISSTLLSLLFSCSSANRNDSSDAKKAQIFYDKGTNEMVNKDYTSALKDLMMAARLDPSDSKIQNNLGMAYLFKGDENKAKYHITKAIELDQSNTDAKVNLANIYLSKNMLNNAEKLYKEILKDLIYDKQFRTYYNLGLLMLKRNNEQGAEHYFDKSIETLAEYCPAHFQKGLIVFKKGFYAKAYDEFVEASKGTCYNEPAPHYYQALSMIELGRFDNARMKLDFIQQEFSSSKYGTMAQIKMSSIKGIKDNSPYQSVSTRLESLKRGKQNSPSF